MVFQDFQVLETTAMIIFNKRYKRITLFRLRQLHAHICLRVQFNVIKQYFGDHKEGHGGVVEQTCCELGSGMGLNLGLQLASCVTLDELANHPMSLFCKMGTNNIPPCRILVKSKRQLSHNKVSINVSCAPLTSQTVQYLLIHISLSSFSYLWSTVFQQY